MTYFFLCFTHNFLKQLPTLLFFITPMFLNLWPFPFLPLYSTETALAKDTLVGMPNGHFLVLIITGLSVASDAVVLPPSQTLLSLESLTLHSPMSSHLSTNGIHPLWQGFNGTGSATSSSLTSCNVNIQVLYHGTWTPIPSSRASCVLFSPGLCISYSLCTWPISPIPIC